MSLQAFTWAARQKLPSTQKLVLLMLADRHNNDTGQCNPSHERLSEDCGLSRRSVVEQIHKLESAGYLRSLARAKGKVRLPNQYQLMLSFGIPEQVRAHETDPYLVVNDVHGGSEPAALGSEPRSPLVVNQLHGGSERRSHKPVNKPVNKPEGEKTPRAGALTRPDDVTEQTWSDWLALRKSKKAPVTQTVLNGAKREAAKAGLSLETFLQIWCVRGSQGMQADWIKPGDIPEGVKTPASNVGRFV